MIHQLFSVMHDCLDGIETQFIYASDEEKRDLLDEMRQLHLLCLKFADEWLRFEERLEECEQWLDPEDTKQAFSKGQGYFHLSMFDRALSEFEQVLAAKPHYWPARLLAGLSSLESGRFGRADEHFRELTHIAQDHTVPSLCYNALQPEQV